MAVGRPQAAKYTRVLQTSFGVLAAAGVVVAAVGVSRGPASSEVVLDPADLKPIARADDAVSVELDAVGAAARIGTVTNAPKPAPVAPPPTQPASGPNTSEPPPAPSSGESPMRYLGLIGFGARPLALMSVNGKQRLVSVGDAIGEEVVAAITADGVTVVPRGRTEEAGSTIALAVRSAEVVTYVSGGRGATPSYPGGIPGGVPGAAGGMNPNYPNSAARMQPNRAASPPAITTPAQAKVPGAPLTYPNFNDAASKAEFIEQVREKIKLEGNYQDEADLEERIRAETERVIAASKMQGRQQGGG